MVAKTIKLPNIRKFFVPDPGCVLVDADLAGADAQVVAWEAGDEDLKAAFRAGLKLHAKNALDMWGPKVVGEDGMRQPYYRDIKQAVHLTNYGGTYQTCARTLGWSEKQARDFQDKWFSLHPGILEWHERTDLQLQGRWVDPKSGVKHPQRTIYNRFGYRIVFFDRISSLLPKALAWTPQSTVALVCSMGGAAVEDKFPFLQMLLQVHDSLLFQIPHNRLSELDYIREALQITVPYEDPLTIQWKIKTSAESWGAAKGD